jgi:hypothetical protein
VKSVELRRRSIDLRAYSENIPGETAVLIPLIALEPKDTVTYSRTTVESTTTSVGFYRGWQAHFYWSEFGTVS